MGAALRRLCHHLISGGRIAAWDSDLLDGQPVTTENITAAIKALERKATPYAYGDADPPGPWTPAPGGVTAS